MATEYGKWRPVKALSEGGQAHTFIVEDNSRQERGQYVLKRLKNIKRIYRFEREIQAVSRLSHPNIVQLIDYNLGGNRPYIVFEFCAGGTLADADIRSLTLLQKLTIFRTIVLAISYAHSKKIIHRDIKPENVFLKADGLTPIIGDFGICFVDEAGERFTLTEEAVGPRLFMAPELEDGKLEEINPSSDVYSLGKLLYWMLSNKEIFSREKHREPGFNLTKDKTTTDIFIIYEFLDKMICNTPTSRLNSAEFVLNELEEVIYKVETGARIPDLNTPQPCIYCGDGMYHKVVDYSYSAGGLSRGHPSEVTNLGFTVAGAPNWLILVCDHCGNVQIFRPDHARSDVWKGRSPERHR